MSAALRTLPGTEGERGRESDAAFVLSLRARGIFDLGVLRVMEIVPRDHFAPRRFADLARSDVALPLACGQTMTAPAVVASMLAALDAKRGHRILEIGTGSGYATALLGRLGAEVRSVERRQVLAEAAWSRLVAGGFDDGVRVEHADGVSDEDEGHYDRILVNGTLSHVPAGLTSRLRAGGRLVCGTPTDTLPRILVLGRSQDGTLTSTSGTSIRLSPLVVGGGTGQGGRCSRNGSLT